MKLDMFIKGIETLARKNREDHKLCPPIEDPTLARWMTDHPQFKMPDDYVALLRLHNGMAIHLDLDPEGAIRFIPLEEVDCILDEKYNGGHPWGLDDEQKKKMASWIGIALDGNGDHILGINTNTGEYLKIPVIHPHEPYPIMPNLEAALSWVIDQYELSLPAPASPKVAKTTTRKSKKTALALTEAYALLGHKTPVLSLGLISSTGELISGGKGYGSMSEIPEQAFRFWSLVNKTQVGSLAEDEHPWIDQVFVEPQGRWFGYHATRKAAPQYEIRVHDTQSKKLLFQHSIIWGRQGSNPTIVCLPDGQHLLSGYSDHTFRMWNVHTGVEIAALKGHADTIWAAALSPDGRVAATGSRDGQLILWDVEARTKLRELAAEGSGITALQFTPDGRQLVLGTRSGRCANVMDITSGKILRPGNAQEGRHPVHGLVS